MVRTDSRHWLVSLILAACALAAAGPAEARKRGANVRHSHQRLVPVPYPQVYGTAPVQGYTPAPIGGSSVYQPISPTGTPELRQRF